ncbi:MAG: dTDP-4-dehydrorhamnose 3,5-epimerase [bacterium]|nr:dTDP-4-dehydrorhamnose 3,5-epimerase [bacterium]
MKFNETSISGLYIVEPVFFGDDRGYFFEAYHKEKFSKAGIDTVFVQDNQSMSKQGTLRGLHLQTEPVAQAKLVRVLSGKIFDVAVDLRRGSPTFCKWIGATLSSENRQMLYIPPGFAHGFYVLSDMAEVSYKCGDFYAPEHEMSITWNDSDIGIEWPLVSGVDLCISERDNKAKSFKEFLKL